MMKSEFIECINALGNPTRFEDLSEDDYQIIEYVYTYHPAISDKKDIAEIFCRRGGFHIIKDMFPTAQYWAKREEEKRKAESKINELQDIVNKFYEERRFVSEY